MQRLFHCKYPKLLALLACTIIAYGIFSQPSIQSQFDSLGSWSYIGIFIAGILFSWGFTTPIAIGIFLTLPVSNIWLAAAIGGFGALIADLAIFSLIKWSFMDEFNRLEKTKPFKRLIKELHEDIPKKIRIYLLYVFAGIVIASPLPDELGVALLAGLGHIKPSWFIPISFICNSVGILAMLAIA